MKQGWLRAIDVRTSRRKYQEKQIEPMKAQQIRSLVEKCNAESGLHIRFVEDGTELFRSFTGSYGMFRGVQSYFALTGDESISHFQEKAGYYGELIVLECTDLGLGTCWVSGTYDKTECRRQIHLGDGEELACVIPVGYVNQEKSIKEKVISLTGRKTKKFEEFIAPSTGLPDWAVKGVEAVGKAPSAMNQQPVRFSYEGGAVKAFVKDPTSHQGIDLGIAQAHFELGARSAGSQGKWILQNDAYIFQ